MTAPAHDAPTVEEQRDGWFAAPLPEAQRGLWFAQCLDPANPVFNTGECFTLRGMLDRAAFAETVETALHEADGLAVRIRERADGPVIEPDETMRPVLEVVDCRGEPDADARALMREDLATPCDLRTDAPARTILFVLDDDTHLWYVRAHHVVIDGYGMRLFADRIADLYSARVSGTAPVSRPFTSYEAVLADADAYAAGERRLTDRAFWQTLLEGHLPAPSLATGAPRPAHSHIEVPVPFTAANATMLRECADRARVTWPDVITALFAAWMERHTGGGTAVPGVAAMLRVGTPAARVPTMAMNVVPCPIRIDDAVSITEFCRGVSRTLREVRRHARYRGEQIRRDVAMLGHDRRLHGPLINILPFGETPAFAGLEVRHEVLSAGPIDDLTLEVRGDAEARVLHLILQANPDLYSRPFVEAYAARLGEFVARALGAERLADVPTLTEAEHAQWVTAVNDTAAPIGDDTLVDVLERTAARVPAFVALRDDTAELTWADWERRTADMARALAARGAEPGALVAVRMRRSIDLVLVIHAIVRAGAAWLPLDPDDPDARIATILDVARPCLVVTDVAADRPIGTYPVMAAPSLRDVTSPVTIAPRRPSPDDPAYVIFTSGSTGTPKGVVITHRAIVNRLRWMADEYRIDEHERLLLKTPVTFDVSVWELLLPVVSGASLTVAPPDAHRDPAELAALMRRSRITTVHFVPSMLAAFLDEPSAHALPLRRVIVSGEALSAPLRDRFHATLDAELHNLYGPTEAAVDVTHWAAGADDRSDPVPIGRPIRNVHTFVLDRALRPVPPGVTGSLYLGGVQLAREYLGRPDLTARAFVDSPFGRIYRTGDRAMWRDDGVLLYLGREDEQVKLRGQRIEPGEIEHVLRQSAGVHDAAVIVREDRAGDQRLVAYVMPAPGATCDSDLLRSAVAERLPAHFVPSAVMMLEALPVSRHGKLDRARLPAPSIETRAEHRALTAHEAVVARHVRDILGLETDPSADDDFFLLGGHSLLAVRLVHALRASGFDITLGTVFAHPVVAALARQLAPRTGDAPPSDRDGLDVLFRFSRESVREDTHAPPLFCIHPAGGLAWCYRPLAQQLAGVREVIGVQARGLLPDAPLPGTLTALAADYLRVIRAEQPEGPVHLLGWSIGGVIAHEIGVQLEQAGEAVGSVTMLDAFPADRWRNAAEADEAAALRALLLIAGIDPEEIPLDRRHSRRDVVQLLEERQHPLAAVSVTTFDGILRSVLHNNRLVRAHRHRPLAADVTYLRAAREHQTDGASPAEWHAYLRGALTVIDVDARHAEMCGSAVSARVADVLGSTADIADTHVARRMSA